MIDYETEMAGTLALAGADRLDEAALERWMRGAIPDFAGPMTITKFKGGQSNPTYRIDTPTRKYVLRRQPFGDLLPSAHAVDREFRIIDALYPVGFPVAAPYGLCEDPAVLGSKFYVMGLAEGRNLWNGALPGLSPIERRATYDAMTDTLAALHSLSPETVGLAEYGKPGDYCARQISRWTKQFRLSQTEAIPEMDRLIDWLPATVPAQSAGRIVHGDFRLDNMIFAAGAPSVVAVLDWELSTLGDPVADFTWYLMNWVIEPDGRAPIAGLDLPTLGIPTIADTVARYRAKAAFPVEHIDWYLAYNLFRFAAILQGVRKRVLDGTASNSQSANMTALIGPLAASAWQFAVKSEAGKQLGDA